MVTVFAAKTMSLYSRYNRYHRYNKKSVIILNLSSNYVTLSETALLVLKSILMHTRMTG